MNPISGTNVSGIVIGGDAHKDQHVAVAIDRPGVRIGQRSLPTTEAGYAGLERWVERLGDITAFGVEGTGSYGAGLARLIRGGEAIP